MTEIYSRKVIMWGIFTTHLNQNWITNKNLANDDIRSHTGFTFLGQEIPACDRMSSLAKFLFMIQFWFKRVVNIPHIMTFLEYISVIT